MEATLVHLESQQKRRIVQRAKRNRTSVAQEFRNALDFYLELSSDQKKELFELAAAANHAADNMIRDLDRTIAAIRRVNRKTGKR